MRKVAILTLSASSFIADMSFPRRAERKPRRFALPWVKADADAFRKRADHCRRLADGTRDTNAQQELRTMAVELDDEAVKIDSDDA